MKFMNMIERVLGDNEADVQEVTDWQSEGETK